MPTGFQSITSSGILQIDADRRCYVLKASGSVVGAGSVATITRPLGIAPLLFIHEGDGGFLFSEIVGSDILYYVYTTPNDNATVRWYEYDVISSAVGTVGLQMFNSAGVISFDSAQRPLIPYAIASNVKPGNNISVAIDTGRTYATNISTTPLKTTYEYTVEKIGDYYTYEIIKPARSGSNLIFSDFDYLGSPEPGIEFNMAPVTSLVIDVHDYIAT